MKPGLMVLLVFIAFLLGAYFMSWVGFTETWPHALRDKVKYLDGWADVFVSACAAAISGLAVYFVSKTLSATQEMAKEQRNMTNLEFRPIIDLVNLKACGSAKRTMLTAEVKNFGRTPGAYLELIVKVRHRSRLGGFVVDLSKRDISTTIAPGETKPILLRFEKPLKSNSEYFATIQGHYAGLLHDDFVMREINVVWETPRFREVISDEAHENREFRVTNTMTPEIWEGVARRRARFQLDL